MNTHTNQAFPVKCQVATQILCSGALVAFVAVTIGSATLSADTPQKPVRTTSTKQPTQQQKNARSLNELAVAAFSNRRFTEASRLLKQAIDLDPGNKTIVFNLAGAYLTLGQEEEAMELLRNQIDAGVEDAGLLARLGDAYFGNQELERAIVHYEKALALDRTYTGVRAKLGSAYTLTHQLDKAEESFKQAILEESANAQLLGNYASVLLINQKPNDAISVCKQALQLQSNRELYITLGAAHEALNNFESALIAYESADALPTVSENDVRPNNQNQALPGTSKPNLSLPKAVSGSNRTNFENSTNKDILRDRITQLKQRLVSEVIPTDRAVNR